MNLYFNDLTVPEDPALMDAALKSFADMFAVFSKLTGANRIWMPKSTRTAILNAIPTSKHIPYHWQWALGAFSLKTNMTPRESARVEDRFCESSFNIDCQGCACSCGQMGLAALTKPIGSEYSLTMGFSTYPFWQLLHYQIVETFQNGNRQMHKVLCMTMSSHETDPDVEMWRQCAYEVELPRSSLAPSEKENSLRDDHGKDILQQLAKRLVLSPYVEGVVNSLPFNPSARVFIEKTLENGLVHIRFVHTDAGYGLVVRTTGRTLDQTQRIAKILDQKYGHHA